MLPDGRVAGWCFRTPDIQGVVVLLVVAVALLLSAGTGLAQDGHLSAGAGGRGFAQLLSRPLPGTPERADADAARALEDALTGFTAVINARVIVTRAPDADVASPSRRAAIQLTLADHCTLTPAWVAGVASFATQALPSLAPDQLTIVTADGAVLYAHGSPAIALEPEPREGGGSVPPGRAGMLPAAAAAACALVVVLLVIGRWRQGAPDIAEPEPEEGPFAFLERLSDDDLRHLLMDERPEVVGLVAHAVADEQAGRVRNVLGAEPVAPVAAVAEPEVVAAVAAALRRKLVER